MKKIVTKTLAVTVAGAMVAAVPLATLAEAPQIDMPETSVVSQQPEVLEESNALQENETMAPAQGEENTSTLEEGNTTASEGLTTAPAGKAATTKATAEAEAASIEITHDVPITYGDDAITPTVTAKDADGNVVATPAYKLTSSATAVLNPGITDLTVKSAGTATITATTTEGTLLTSAVTLTVKQAPSTMKLEAKANAKVGEVALTATMTGINQDDHPQGIVTFEITPTGSTLLALPAADIVSVEAILDDGVATYNANTIGAGTYDITATYKSLPNGNYAECAPETINKYSVEKGENPVTASIAYDASEFVYGDNANRKITITLTNAPDPSLYDPSKMILEYDGLEEVVGIAPSGSYEVQVKPTRAGEVGVTSITFPANDNFNEKTVKITDKTTVAKKQLGTVTGTKAADKVYNGTPKADITVGTLAEGDLEARDAGNVTLTATGNFENKNAAVDKKSVTVEYSLDGAAKENYLPPDDEQVTATISPLPVEVAEAKVVDRDYAGENNKGVVVSATAKNFVKDDDVKLATDGTFKDGKAGENKDVTVTYSLNGNDAGNYTEPANATLKGTINRKPLNVLGTDVADKEYDGTITAIVRKAGSTIEDQGMAVVSGDDVSLDTTKAPTTANYENADVGDAKVATATYALKGEQSLNYLATGTATGNISQATPTITLEVAGDIAKEPITLTAKVKTNSKNGAAPEGTVTFTTSEATQSKALMAKQATNSDAIALENGVASYSIKLDPGTYSFSASYTPKSGGNYTECDGPAERANYVVKEKEVPVDPVPVDPVPVEPGNPTDNNGGGTNVTVDDSTAMNSNAKTGDPFGLAALGALGLGAAGIIIAKKRK